MTNEVIYKNLERIIDRETSGGYLDPQTYNYFANIAVENVFKRITAELYGRAGEGMTVGETLYSSKEMRPFVEIEESLAVTSGDIDITTLTDYAYWVKMMTSTAYNGQIRKIDLEPHARAEGRKSNILARQAKRNPFAEIIGDLIRVYPHDITAVDFIYIRRPVVPVFDYYFDADKQIIYLAEGADYTLQANEVYSDGTTSGTVSSLTKELEFTREYHVEFVTEMALLLGIKEEDQLRGQFERVEQQIQEQT